MKEKLLYMLAFLMVALIVFSGYRSVVIFKTMHRQQEAESALSVLQSLSTLINTAGREAFESARFFGVKGVNYLDRLEKSRQDVDRAIVQARGVLSAATHACVRPNDLDTFAHRLKTIRAAIDILDPGNEHFLSDPDKDDPVQALLLRVNPCDTMFAHTGVDREIAHYLQTLYDTKALMDEQALMAFFLARNRPLSKENIQAWELAMEGKGAVAPLPTSLHTLRALSDQARDEKTIADHLRTIRADIFEHAETAGFVAQLYNVEEAFFEPIRIIQRTRKKLFDRISLSLSRDKERNKTSLIEFIATIMVLTIFLYSLYRFIYVARREKNALEESLREIVSDLDPQRRKELEKIMQKGDRVAVYRFLADTTLAARAAEERSLKAERARDIFLANMSHEIRTPLNGILGFAQLMQSTPLTAEQREFMGVIEGSSTNLLKIVNDILDLSKIHAEKIELESIPFSLVYELEEAIEPHAARALERGINYSTFIDPTMPQIKSDPAKITQVMTNLIGNAVKFTNEGGTVDIDVRKIRESDDIVTIRFSIKDSGIGISAEERERIFEPFSQADTSTTRNFGGTGLGLTITRDIIDHLGGSLELTSEVGRGSEFFFELTFERMGEDDAFRNRLEGVTIALYHTGESTLQQMERNLALYARSMGARFRTVGDQDLDLIDDVDVLLLDYSNRETREKIEQLLWLGKKTVLISTMTQQHETDNLSSRVDQIVYRPLTASKLIQVHESMDVVPAPVTPDVASEKDLTLNGLQILVAEDNPINQKLVARVLEGMEVVATLVDNGKEALEMRKAQEFDGILMDIQMPVMGGLESTREILAYEHARGVTHVPIIALTANALQGDRERYLREGFDDYISKPVNLDQLRQTLIRHCARPVSDEGDLLELNGADDDTMELFNFHTVLMYSHSNGLVQRIHKDALTYAGHTFFSVSNEANFLETLKIQMPDVVLIDTYSVELDRCWLLEQVRDRGAKLFIYGHISSRLGCDLTQVSEYTSVSMLLNSLR